MDSINSTAIKENIYHYINIDYLSVCIQNPLVERLNRIALPFLNLYQPTAQIVLFGNAGIKSALHLKMIVVCAYKCEWKKGSQELFALVITVSTLAATIFYYRAGLIVGLSIELSGHLRTICTAFKQRHYSDAGKSALKAAQSTFYFTSVVIPNPALIIAASLLQISAEGFNSFHEFKKGRYLEGIALLLLAGIRGVRLKGQIEEYRNPVGGSLERSFELTTDEAQQFILDFHEYKQIKMDAQQPVIFQNFLKSKGYPLHLKQVNFTEIFSFDVFSAEIKSSIFNHVDFTNVSFSNCTFANVNLNECSFTNSSLIDCSFHSTSLSQGLFKNSLIKDSCFNLTKLSQSLFNNVKIEGSIFLNSRLENSNFTHVLFNNTILKASFLNQCDFNDVSFINCNFASSYLSEASFTKTHFNRVNLKVDEQSDVSIGDFDRAAFHFCSINDSSFSNANFKESSWISCSIKSTDFSDSTMAQSSIIQTTFKDTSLNYVNFNDAMMDYDYFYQCSLTGTAFLNAKPVNTMIMSCDLTDSLFFNTQYQFQFFNCSENIITRPVVGLSQILGFRGFNTREIYKGIKKGGAIPVRLDNQVSNIDREKLSIELTELMKAAQMNQESPEFYSLLDEVLKLAKPGSEIDKIKFQASRYVKHMDGILIPGGSDIEPLFYNQETEAHTLVEGDNGLRTVFELALNQATHQNQIPLIGICRGAQVAALYHGAPGLNQNVPNQYGVIQDFTIGGGQLKEIMGDSIRVISMHHQCIEDPGPHLIVTIETETKADERSIRIIKAMEHPNGLVFLFQFHPEYGFTSRSDQITPNNINAFYALKQLADEKKKYGKGGKEGVV